MSIPTTAVARYQPVLSDVERMTMLGFLAGYRGFTRDAYALDLRQFTAWCWQHDQHLFDVRRVDIECYGRDLEDRGKARATVARRLCTVVGFYRYAEDEGIIEHSPALHIRRARIDYESHVAHLDRNELGAILVTAGMSSPRDHALVSLLALSGLRVSEAIGANIEALGQERGHRTLTVVREGGSWSRCRSPHGSRGPSIWPSVNGWTDRSSSTPTASDWTGTPQGGSCGASPAAPGSANESGPTPCATRSSPPWTPASPCATCRKRPVSRTRARRCVTTGAARASTVTPSTSSPPSSPAPVAHSSTPAFGATPRPRHRAPGRRIGGHGPTVHARRTVDLARSVSSGDIFGGRRVRLRALRRSGVLCARSGWLAAPTGRWLRVRSRRGWGSGRQIRVVRELRVEPEQHPGRRAGPPPSRRRRVPTDRPPTPLRGPR